MIQIGDKAPLDAIALDLNENQVSLSAFQGKWIVLYFYPKDNTSGCTKEACGFRDFNKDIEKLGVKVIGVSKDSVKSHKKFVEKHELNFALWSDEPDNSNVPQFHEVFGVWVEKSMYGKKYMGAQRSTFVINPDGEIAHVWEKVKPAEHAKEVFEWLEENV